MKFMRGRTRVNTSLQGEILLAHVPEIHTENPPNESSQNYRSLRRLEEFRDQHRRSVWCQAANPSDDLKKITVKSAPRCPSHFGYYCNITE